VSFMGRRCKKRARRVSLGGRSAVYGYLLLVLILDLAGGQADLLDAAVRGAGDGAVKVAPDELVAHLGQTAQLLLDQTADGDGVNVVVLLDAQLVGGVVNTGAAGDQPAAGGRPRPRRRVRPKSHRPAPREYPPA